MTGRVLHLLSQRPMLTGSGVTLQALVRSAHAKKWHQAALLGVPANEDPPAVIDIPSDRVFTVPFGSGPLAHPVVGMSDVMPYQSTRFSDLTQKQVDTYLDTWRESIARAIAEFEPDVIHTHHVWLMSSVVADVTDIPTVVHCHGTGLRQMALCPKLGESAIPGLRRNAHFLALHGAQKQQLARLLQIDEHRISVVGAGVHSDVFAGGAQSAKDPKAVLYAGKLSCAKGVPQLIAAMRDLPRLTLHVVGGGDGDEADSIRELLAELGPRATCHGRVSQDELVRLFSMASVFVLPSFYEGLPLVIIEALASGCRVVSTALPGVVEQIAPHVEEHIELVEMPRLVGPDVPHEADVPAFIANLREAIATALRKGPTAANVDAFGWNAVFDRAEKAWRRAMSPG